MLPSGNDAALSLAESMGALLHRLHFSERGKAASRVPPLQGDPVRVFVREMNKMARTMHLGKTHEPTGESGGGRVRRSEDGDDGGGGALSVSAAQGERAGGEGAGVQERREQVRGGEAGSGVGSREALPLKLSE